MGFLKHISVEVALLLLFFSFMLSDSVYTNQIIYRTCYILLGQNKSECALLGNTNNNITEKLEKLVEPHSAIITMVKSLTESIFSVFLCLFIGPWSDRFGRKPILVLGLIGYVLTFLGISLFSYFDNLSPWYVIICTIPIILTGGAPAFLTVVLAYITDVTSEENRGMRMGLFEALIAVGMLLGTVSSSYVFYATNYVSVFAICALCNFVGLLFVIFFVDESVANPETQGRWKGFFQLTNVIDMIKVSVKKRQRNHRAIIMICVVISTLYLFGINGDGSVFFLFLREKFQWTLQKYTLFNSATGVLWVLGTLLGVYVLNKLLKIPESQLILMGFISLLSSMLLYGFATKDAYIYAAGVVRCFGAVLGPMLRSLYSKLVTTAEIGKIFSLVTTVEFLIGVAAGPLYTTIYNATINKDAALFTFVTAGFYGVGILLVIVVMILQRVEPVNNEYDQLNNEQEEEEAHINATNTII